MVQTQAITMPAIAEAIEVNSVEFGFIWRLFIISLQLNYAAYQ